MEDKVSLNEYQYHPYPMSSGVNQEETMTQQDSSTISPQDKLREKITQILSRRHHFADGHTIMADVEEIQACYEEALPELAKEAGYKSPEEVEEFQAELTEKFATKFEERVKGYVKLASQEELIICAHCKESMDKCQCEVSPAKIKTESK